MRDHRTLHERTPPPTRETPDIPGVIAPPPVVYGGVLALSFLLGRLVPIPLLLPEPLRILGSICIAASIPIAVSAFRALARHRTSVRVERPTTALVVDGPFRYSRNPIYASLTLLYLGVATLANFPWAILLLPLLIVVVRRGIIDREEHYLQRKFGQDYLTYKGRVRRWF